MKYVSPKWLCALGFGLFGLASFSSGVLNPDFAGPQFNQIQIIRALGQPLIMVTISLIATAYISRRMRVGVEPVQHPAQPRRRHRHRPAGDPAGCADQDLFRLFARAVVPSNPQVAERLAS
jgi:DHA2 family multidrug resistance protein